MSVQSAQPVFTHDEQRKWTEEWGFPEGLLESDAGTVRFAIDSWCAPLIAMYKGAG